MEIWTLMILGPRSGQNLTTENIPYLCSSNGRIPGLMIDLGNPAVCHLQVFSSPFINWYA